MADSEPGAAGMGGGGGREEDRERQTRWRASLQFGTENHFRIASSFAHVADSRPEAAGRRKERRKEVKSK